MNEIREARQALDQRNQSVEEMRKHIAQQDRAIDALSVKLGRPRGGALDLDDTREQAIALLQVRHLVRSPKREVGVGLVFQPSEDVITEAKAAISGAKICSASSIRRALTTMSAKV